MTQISTLSIIALFALLRTAPRFSRSSVNRGVASAFLGEPMLAWLRCGQNRPALSV
jgi:hypothetical protein